MRHFIFGLVVGILLLPVCAFLYLYLGYAPVATAASPLPLERTLTGMALHARIDRDAPKQSPVPADEANLMAGAKIYLEYCAMCHGTRTEPQTPTAKGMFPHPPQLLRGKGVTDDPPGETYWKAANGIRLTGMPAYRGSLTDVQLWDVSQMLANANNLPPAVNAELAAHSPAR